jgi:hypothetical protein
MNAQIVVWANIPRPLVQRRMTVRNVHHARTRQKPATGQLTAFVTQDQLGQTAARVLNVLLANTRLQRVPLCALSVLPVSILLYLAPPTTYVWNARQIPTHHKAVISRAIALATLA